MRTIAKVLLLFCLISQSLFAGKEPSVASATAIMPADKAAAASVDVTKVTDTASAENEKANNASATSVIDTEMKVNLKSGMRKFLEGFGPKLKKEDFGNLPEGIEIIDGNGFRGIKVIQGKLEFRTHTWTDNTGLLDNYKLCRESGEEIIAAINGSFFSERGVLGQVITDGFSASVRQIPARLSRCFLASFRGGKNFQFWYLGETPLNSRELLDKHDKAMVWYNGGGGNNEIRIDNLIGGGGWILKNRKDAHNEAVERQFFRFRREDQTSRKTVIAQDNSRNLYFLVFEEGFTLHQVARCFVKTEMFKDVNDAIFLDGGSSSCIVLKGKYLVPPLYLIDKCRFSCIKIMRPEVLW